MPGRASSLADWQDAERAIERKIPLAWIEFVQVFGGGRIHLEALRREEWHAAPAVTSTYLVAYKEGNYWPSSFDSDIYGAGACRCELHQYDYFDEYASTTHPAGIGNRKDWIEVGSALSGDSLQIRTGVRSDEPEALRALEGEVAWYNHEVGRFVFRWPSVEAFLRCLADWNKSAVRQPTKEEEDAAREIARRELLRQRGANMPVLLAIRQSETTVKCSHCNWTFFPTDKTAWNGERHTRCAGPLIID